jgi:hypothetical protein
MAGLFSNIDDTTQTVSYGHQESHSSNNEPNSSHTIASHTSASYTTASHTTASYTQSSTTSTHNYSDGIYRTSASHTTAPRTIASHTTALQTTAPQTIASRTTASHTTVPHTTASYTQSATTSTHNHSDGIYRTSSGRETYYPDGHESRTRGAGLFCEHDGHQQTPVLNSRSSYGLFPAQETSRTQQSSETQAFNNTGVLSDHNAQGEQLQSSSNSQKREEVVLLERAESSSLIDATTRTQQSSETQAFNSTGVLSDHNAQGEQLQSSSNSQKREEVVLLERAESSSLSDATTRYGSNGPRNKREQSESSIPDAPHGAMLERRTTRAEIDDEGRQELQRIFTTRSQKMSRQISIAQPGDATVDPSSDSFDLSRFLKMFR